MNLNQTLWINSIAYLGHDTTPRSGNNKRNPYSDWQTTPLPEDKRGSLFATWAIRGCDENKYDYVLANSVGKWSKEPGGYYIMTSDSEGMILVFPTHLRAFHLYFDPSSIF
jgi:hypothetical protein